MHQFSFGSCVCTWSPVVASEFSYVLDCCLFLCFGFERGGGFDLLCKEPESVCGLTLGGCCVSVYFLLSSTGLGFWKAVIFDFCFGSFWSLTWHFQLCQVSFFPSFLDLCLSLYHFGREAPVIGVFVLENFGGFGGSSSDFFSGSFFTFRWLDLLLRTTPIFLLP